MWALSREPVMVAVPPRELVAAPAAPIRAGVAELNETLALVVLILLLRRAVLGGS